MKFLKSYILIFLTVNLVGDCNDKPNGTRQLDSSENQIMNPNYRKAKRKEWFNFILKRLEESGIQKSTALSYLNQKGLSLQPELIASNLGFVKELKSLPGSSNYNQSKGMSQRDFIKQYQSFLLKTSYKYQVPEEVILSILWVESRIGMNIGKFSVLNVYFNLALLQNPEVFSDVFRWIKKKYPRQDRFQLFKKIWIKGQWGLKELISLIILSEQHKINISSLYGSYAGAFGIPQFIPSSYLSYAKDGNGDGVIDLFNIKDAIVSTANYLSKKGWTTKKRKQHRAILSYNNSYRYLYEVIHNSKRLKRKLYFYRVSPSEPLQLTSPTEGSLKRGFANIMKMNNKSY